MFKRNMVFGESVILIRNKHVHPLLYMRGVKSKDLMAILYYLYFGETNVYQ